MSQVELTPKAKVQEDGDNSPRLSPPTDSNVWAQKEVREAIRSELDLMFSQAPSVVRFRAWLFEKCEGRPLADVVAQIRHEVGLDGMSAGVLNEYLEIMVDQGWLYRDKFGRLHRVQGAAA